MTNQISTITSNFDLAADRHFSVTTRIDYSPDIKVYELVPSMPGDKYAMIKADYIYNDAEAIRIISEIFSAEEVKLVPPKTGVQSKGSEGTLSAFFTQDDADPHNVYILAKYR